MRRIYPLVTCLLAAALLMGLSACSSGDKETTYVQTAYSPGSYFVTNIRDSNKMLRSEIVLTFEVKEDTATPGSPNADEIKAIEGVNHLIRDCIIEVLRDKTEDELRDSNAMNNMREELIDELINRLGLDSLIDLSFTDFVFQ